ncbi:MAG TPA: penicillin-binding protein 2 [Rugosimonospora sp.]|nr:penicillin-binding protein 2 [Rugosimonospora sp.]
MNAPLRRVGVVVIVLFALLFINLNWVQAYKADAYRTNEHNARVQLSAYQRQRGSIVLSDGQTIVAQSVATTDTLKYLRKYPLGAPFAQVVGYQSVNGGSTGIERVENDFLSGNASSLFTNRIKDIFTGNKTSGGNIMLTLSKAAQEKAYDDLVNNQVGAKHAAAVAIDPGTGAILAMASTPSYDPNPIVSHDTEAAQSAYDALDKNADEPLLNRAVQTAYPPGSTMKVVVSAAALSTGQYNPQSVLQATNSYTPIAGGGFSIHNAGPGTCPQANITLIDALTVSCNTAFARLGVSLGADKVKSMAQAFGFEDTGLTVASEGNASITVAASHTGPMTGSSGQDDPNAVAQSSIGQLDVVETPLQDALVAATVANGGVEMRPYLVEKQQAPDLTTTFAASPKTWHTPISSAAAGQLQQMMESVVQNGTGTAAQIDGYQVGGKTGTAQNGETANTHGWFIGFAMKDGKPIVAVCVFLERAGNGGSHEAARIAGDIMKAVIAERGAK